MSQPSSFREDPDQRPDIVPRSAFLVRLGVSLGALSGAAGALLGNLFSSVPALASIRPAASISSSMPVASKIGLFLGNVSALKPNSALAYTDPKSGDPAILIRLANGQLVSYDMVCPHRGCTVPYDPTRQVLVCPCHGAQFDPVHAAAPLSGPVSQPLITLPIRTDTAGNVYALDAQPGTKVNRLHAAPAASARGDDGGSDSDDSATGTGTGSGTGRHHHHGGDD